MDYQFQNVYKEFQKQVLTDQTINLENIDELIEKAEKPYEEFRQNRIERLQELINYAIKLYSQQHFLEKEMLKVNKQIQSIEREKDHIYSVITLPFDKVYQEYCEYYSENNL